MTSQVFTIPANYNLDYAVKTVTEKLNPSWIEQRKQGSATLSYIGGHIVIRLLNKAFNYQWSFEIVSEEIVQSLPKAIVKWEKGQKINTGQFEAQPPVVKVLGRLTVPGLGIKEQYGSKVLIGGATEQESAFKSASTDALKKCASLLGIGLDLYGEAEGLEYQAHETYMTAPVQQTAPVQTAPVTTTAPVETPAPATNVQSYVPPTPAQPIQEAPPVDINQFQTASQAMQNQDLAIQQNQPINSDPEPQGTVFQPQVQEKPQAQAQTGAVHVMAWPPAEVTKLVENKAKLGVENNQQLDPYIREWLNNAEVTYQNITPENITAFNVFLQGKLQ